MTLAWVAGSSGAPTAAPPGPRLVVGVWPGESATRSELLTVGPDGEEPQAVSRAGALAGRPDLERPVWNADGTELAFYGPGDETPAVYLVDPDGPGPRVLATSEHPGGPDNATLSNPLFDPRTGDVLVAVVHTPHGEGLFGGERPNTGSVGRFRTEFWELPIDGSKGRRLSSRPLTRKHPLIPFPSSISASGWVVASALTRRGFAVVMIDPHTGATRSVVPTTKQKEGSLEPMISPDGKEIVYKVNKQTRAADEGGVVSTALMIVPTKGGTPRLLARVKGEAWAPSWDPSGSRIAFTAAAHDAVMVMNADGSCLTAAYSAPAGGAVEGAAWQPGADRGAGPIEC